MRLRPCPLRSGWTGLRALHVWTVGGPLYLRALLRPAWPCLRSRGLGARTRHRSLLAGLRDAAAVSRAARRDVADVLPAARDERLDVPDGQPDDPAELRDAQDARQDGRDARRDGPAVCREDRDDRLAGRAERPVGQAARRYRAGQAARLHRDDRDVGPEDARRVGPDERRGDDPGHPGAKRREAA